MNDSIQNKAIGALVGLAAGDALDTTIDFKPRGTFERHGEPFQGSTDRNTAGNGSSMRQPRWRTFAADGWWVRSISTHAGSGFSSPRVSPPAQTPTPST